MWHCQDHLSLEGEQFLYRQAVPSRCQASNGASSSAKHSCTQLHGRRAGWHYAVREDAANVLPHVDRSPVTHQCNQD